LGISDFGLQQGWHFQSAAMEVAELWFQPRPSLRSERATRFVIPHRDFFTPGFSAFPPSAIIAPQ